MKVIEIIQFNEDKIKNIPFDLALIDLNGLQAKVCDIDPESNPRKGYVWYSYGPYGECKAFKSNYDTSD